VEDALTDDAVSDEVAPVGGHLGQQLAQETAEQLGPGPDPPGDQLRTGWRRVGQLQHHQPAVPRMRAVAQDGANLGADEVGQFHRRGSVRRPLGQAKLVRRAAAGRLDCLLV